MANPTNTYYKRQAKEYHEQTITFFQNWACCGTEQGDMTDLEFRLYWRVPASIFYKRRKQHRQMQQDLKSGKAKLKWRRWRVG